jgi:cell division protein FtsB
MNQQDWVWTLVMVEHIKVRIWVFRWGAWVVYEDSFVREQDEARMSRYRDREAAKVASAASKLL